MVCIILDPVGNITLSNQGDSVSCTRVRNILRKHIVRNSTCLTRSRNDITKDAIGNVTDISKDTLLIDCIPFDIFSSYNLRSSGVSRKTDTGTSKKETPRCYIMYDTDVLPGDYILVDYDTDLDTWSAKYLVEEVEQHHFKKCVVFNTIYLKKVEN